jgi:hypothetical protein
MFSLELNFFSVSLCLIIEFIFQFRDYAFAYILLIFNYLEILIDKKIQSSTFKIQSLLFNEYGLFLSFARHYLKAFLNEPNWPHTTRIFLISSKCNGM